MSVIDLRTYTATAPARRHPAPLRPAPGGPGRTDRNDRHSSGPLTRIGPRCRRCAAPAVHHPIRLTGTDHALTDTVSAAFPGAPRRRASTAPSPPSVPSAPDAYPHRGVPLYRTEPICPGPHQSHPRAGNSRVQQPADRPDGRATREGPGRTGPGQVGTTDRRNRSEPGASALSRPRTGRPPASSCGSGRHRHRWSPRRPRPSR